MSELQVCKIIMNIYNYTFSELQHFVMQPLLPVIEGDKLACAHTQNRALFKMLGFRRSGHKYCENQNMANSQKKTVKMF